MTVFYCNYCNREMHVSFLQYKENHFCNTCFSERIKNTKSIDVTDYNKVISEPSKKLSPKN